MQPTVPPVSAPVPAPTATPEPSFIESIGGSTSSFLDSLMQGPARATEPPATPAVGEPPVDAPAAPIVTEETAPPTTEPDDAAELAALIAQFRAEHPEAPDTFIKRLADKEAHIKKQSKQITELLNDKLKKPAERQPTAFELSLQAPPAAPPAVAPVAAPVVAQAPPAQPAAPPQPTLPPYMESPETAEAAYAEAIGNADFRLAGEIRRNIASMEAYQQRQEIEALADERAQRIIQQQFGHLLPTLQQQAADQAANANLEFAVSELEQRGRTNIRQMFQPVDDSAIEADGRKWANTPMNQALAKYPFLRQIQVQHADPTTARRLTLIARYEAAADLMAGQAPAAPGPPAAQPPSTPAAPTGMLPDQVQALIQSGRELAEREAVDRVRHGMNAGPGATSASGGSAPARFIDELGGSTSSIMSEISNPAFLRRG